MDTGFPFGHVHLCISLHELNRLGRKAKSLVQKSSLMVVLHLIHLHHHKILHLIQHLHLLWMLDRQTRFARIIRLHHSKFLYQQKTHYCQQFVRLLPQESGIHLERVCKPDVRYTICSH